MLKLLPIDSALQQSGQLGIFKILIKMWKCRCPALSESPEPEKVTDFVAL